MAESNGSRTDFVEALSWMGAPPYTLLFYAVCNHATKVIIDEVRVHWDNKTHYDFFRLADDWPFEVALVEIAIPEIPEDLDTSLLATLEVVARKLSTATFFMFEGGFCDYRRIFDLELQGSIYGLCVENAPAIVCTIDQDRKSQALADEIMRAKLWLINKYFPGGLDVR